MAISKEALDYLQKMEEIENWTSIPDDDERMVKLRKLFYCDPEADENERWG